MARYISEVEAVQWFKKSVRQRLTWDIPNEVGTYSGKWILPEDHFFIDTPDGLKEVFSGDWITYNPSNGDFQVMSYTTFRSSYRKIKELEQNV